MITVTIVTLQLVKDDVMSKVYTIKRTQDRRITPTFFTGTVPELVAKFAYTLEVGQSWEHEKGNSKINHTPKTIASLINNINNAVNNAAANGYAGVHYSLVEEPKEPT